LVFHLYFTYLMLRRIRKPSEKMMARCAWLKGFGECCGFVLILCELKRNCPHCSNAFIRDAICNEPRGSFFFRLRSVTSPCLNHLYGKLRIHHRESSRCFHKQGQKQVEFLFIFALEPLMQNSHCNLINRCD